MNRLLIPDLLTVREAADWLRLHPKSLYRMAHAGRIDHVRDGRRILFERARIRERIERGQVRSAFEFMQQQPLICLAEFDKLHLRGGQCAVSKETRRWRYGIGTIYLRETKQGKGRWCIDYKDGQGKRRREVISTAQNRGEALVALQAKISEIFSGKFSPPRKSESGTFKGLSDLYMVDYAKKEKKSWETDEFRLRKIKESLGDIKLLKITDSTIRDYRQQRLDEGISPLTANRELALLKKMFGYAAEKGMMGENPARKVKMFSEADTARDRTLSPAEELRLFAELAPHMKPIVLLGLYGGLRLGEALGLNWSDVNLEKRTVKVEHTKGKRARFVPLNSVLCAEFEKLRMAKLDAKIIFPFKRRSVRTGFENALKAGKIEGLTFHDLRRSFGTRLLERGVSLVVIQRLYGHQNIQTTLSYLHPRDVLSEEAVELLASHGSRDEQKRPENLSHICHTGRKSAVSPPLSRSFSVN